MKYFAVTGNPISQSKSPIIHQQFASQFNIELSYEKILSTNEEFNEMIKQFFIKGSGMNVTAPFKELAFQAAKVRSESAILANAVNTLYVEDGQLHGDTTDGVGLVNDLKYHGVQLIGKRVLLLGAGGAARGSVKALVDEQPQSLTVSNRTVSKAQAIKDAFNHPSIYVASFDELDEHYDVIINSTSCSLHNEILDISTQCLSKAQYVYDMSYKNETTSFNKWAQENSKATTIDGLGMLIEQAAESFRIWHGVMPNTDKLRKTLRTS